ncbi:MAG: hypothetical protein SGI92_23000, partial [Bryobacteraceae bacterium]|nr:hypothetical protein [Bryobacteraceae bacterium]
LGSVIDSTGLAVLGAAVSIVHAESGAVAFKGTTTGDGSCTAPASADENHWRAFLFIRTPVGSVRGTATSTGCVPVSASQPSQVRRSPWLGFVCPHRFGAAGLSVGHKRKCDQCICNNVLNHPLKAPNNYDIGNLGTFAMGVNATTRRPEIIRVTPNPDFGRLIASYSQEGIDARRMVRLRLRITF